MDWSQHSSCMQLDDDVWVLNVLSDGMETVQRSISFSDIQLMNLRSLIVTLGFKETDCIYYVKEQGRGIPGMILLDSNKEVETMVKKYQTVQVVNLTVVRRLGPVVGEKRARSVVDEAPLEQQALGKDIIDISNMVSDSDSNVICLGEGEKDDCGSDTDIEDMFTSTIASEQIIDVDICHGKAEEEEAHASDGIGDDLIASDDDGFVVPTSKPPMCRKSRAKPLPEREWWDEEKSTGSFEELHKNLCFISVYQFRRALKNAHIVNSRDYKNKRNDKKTVSVWCVEGDKCMFSMRASEIQGENTFCIRKYEQHTCGLTRESSRINSSWLSKKYEENFVSDPGWKVDALIEHAMRDHGVEVSKPMAYRAKNKVVDLILGNHKGQYYRIRDYLQTVIDRNPGSRCIVDTRPQQPPAMNPRFHGLFFCLNGPKEGFLNGCRPFIGLDGCFVKLNTGAQVLAATGRDGNDNLYPIAFAVVGKEDIPSWTWFLEQLKEALGGEGGKFGNWTIMSDRQKGLLNATNNVFPNCSHRYCLRHIYANFQSAGFKGKDLKKLMDNAAYAWNRGKFEEAMNKLLEKNQEAHDWLANIPVQHWARHALDTNCKTDLVVNNLSEVFNNFILDVRDKPIVTMINQIRCKLTARFHNKREGVLKQEWEITPHYIERLEVEKKDARFCRPTPSTNGLWQVVSFNIRTYVVNLDAMSCSCGKWSLTGIPCKHSISCIYKLRKDPEDYVVDFFKRELYQLAYQPVIYPVPDMLEWTKTPSFDIDPPVFTKHPGRTKKNRRKGVHEVPHASGKHRMTTTTCSNCHIQGHKYSTCTKELRPELVMRMRQWKTNRNRPVEDDGGDVPPPPPPPPPPPRQPQSAPAAIPTLAPFRPPRQAEPRQPPHQQDDANDGNAQWYEGSRMWAYLTASGAGRNN